MECFAAFGVTPISLDLHLDAYEGPSWRTKPFRNRSGWLTIAEARLPMSFGTWRRTLVACISDRDEVFSSAVAETVFNIPTSLPKEADDYEPECLEAVLDDLQLAFMRETDRNNLRFSADFQENTEAKITAYETRCRKIENGIAETVRFLRSERRLPDLPRQALSGIDAKLARLASMSDALGVGMRDRIRAMRASSNDVEAEVMASLGKPGPFERTCTVRWRSISQHRRQALAFPAPPEHCWLGDPFGSRIAFGPLGWDHHRHAATE